MSEMLGTLLRTVVLDDSAYQEWRERPNLFLRGIILIAIVTLVAGVITFTVNLVNRVRPIDAAMADLDATFDQALAGEEFPWVLIWENVSPRERQMIVENAAVVKDMIVDVVSVRAPLPRGITGFFESLGAYLSTVLAALGGWLFYGALVLIAVNLLGGSAKLPDFLGTVSLYAIPGLLALLEPIPCLGWLLALIGTIWAIVVYIKAVSVSTGLDAGRSILAAIAPFIVIFLLGILLALLVIVWFTILIP